MLPRAPRQVEHLAPLLVLAPAVPLAFVVDRAPKLPPVADGREAQLADGSRAGVPEVEHDRLARGPEVELLGDRKPADLRAEVLGEREVRGVCGEEVDRRLQSVVQLDLQTNRVGLEVDEPPGLGELGQRIGRAVQVDDELGLAEEPA